eukprot:7304232-Alexandrium_andersonii.AAC.1
MLRVSLELERSGQPLTAAETEKLARKGKYCEVLQGQSPKKQVEWLKSEFSKVLLGDSFEESEYNGRLDALMDLLRARGGEPSASAQKMFSNAGSQDASQEASPEKAAAPAGVGVGLADSPRGADPAR